MLKTTLQLFRAISALFSVVMAFWIFLITIFLLLTGGRYSVTTEDGSMVCGIWIFAENGVLWTLFELYGVPLIIISASWRTIIFCSERLNR